MKPTNQHNAPNREEVLHMLKHNMKDPKWENDAFVQDALEGIRLLSSPENSFKRLDKRYFTFTWWLPILAIVIISSLGTLYYFNKPTQIKQGDNTNRLAQEKIEQKIESEYITQSSPAQHTNSISKLKKGSDNRSTYLEGSDIVNNQLQTQAFELNELPTQAIDTSNTTSFPIKLSRTGKEIYLHDLKTVDYRVYRSAPKKSISTQLLTGTPASENNLPENDISSDSIPYITFITNAMKNVKKGNYSKAKIQFGQILKEYPADINALFYAGICNYELADYSNALIYFKKAEKGEFDNFEEEAEWFQLKCYQKTGDTGNIERLTKRIRDRKGFYSKKVNP